MRVFAIDNSGSTSGSKVYWDTVEQILKGVSASDKIIFWNDSSQIVPHNNLINFLRKGSCGTSPKCFGKRPPKRTGSSWPTRPRVRVITGAAPWI